MMITSRPSECVESGRYDYIVLDGSSGVSFRDNDVGGVVLGGQW